MTGPDLSAFGVDVPEPETDVRMTDTSDDYKFTRPQCIALTAAGDRCSNPTRRGEDTPFCPRHDGMDVETVDDWTPEPATLREGETTDDETHARRTAEQLSKADAEAEGER